MGGFVLFCFGFFLPWFPIIFLPEDWISYLFEVSCCVSAESFMDVV